MKGRKRINHFYVFGMSSLAFGGSSFLGETSLGPYQEFWKKKKKKEFCSGGGWFTVEVHIVHSSQDVKYALGCVNW